MTDPFDKIPRVTLPEWQRKIHVAIEALLEQGCQGMVPYGLAIAAAIDAVSDLVQPPLVSYMTAETTPERDAAFLRMYAARVLDRTASSWEIPNTVATTLQDIANRIEAR